MTPLQAIKILMDDYWGPASPHQFEAQRIVLDLARECLERRKKEAELLKLFESQRKKSLDSMEHVVLDSVIDNLRMTTEGATE